MPAEVEVNVDTNVLYNFLYSTVLPDRASKDPTYERDRGCKDYFEEDWVCVVVGGSAESEFRDGIDRREIIYMDIANYLESTANGIATYDLRDRDVSFSNNDKRHLERDMLQKVCIESSERQLSVTRECHQALGECARSILIDEVDELKDAKEDDDLRGEFESRLGIGYDCDILVDAVYISLEDGVSVLASCDSDLADKEHKQTISNIIDEMVDPIVKLTIVHPSDKPVNELAETT